MAKSGWVAVVVSTLAFLASPVEWPDGWDGALGVRPAMAKDAFYTRKRVNGRWVTGRFPYKRVQTAAAAAAAPVAASAAAIAAPHVSKPEDPPATGSLVDPAPLAAALPPAFPERSALDVRPPRGLFFPEREIRSIVLDYRTGIRTIFYEDGGVVEEPDMGQPIVANTIHRLPLLPAEAAAKP